MKVRPSAEVFDVIDDEFAWRRKELTAIWNDVKSSRPASRSARIRSAVAILYAHWEGFIKAASETYIAYVAGRRLKYSQLNKGLLALCLRTKLQELATTDETSAHISFINFLSHEMDTRARVPTQGVIRTGANLSSKRLKSIVLALGLDYSPFELKEHLIDVQLLQRRNEIAHGRWSCSKEHEFDHLYQEMTALLRNFKDQLNNAIILDTHLR